MTYDFENQEQQVVKDNCTQSMRDLLSNEAFSDAMKNSKNMPVESRSDSQKSSATDTLPMLTIDDQSHKGEKDLNDATKDAAKALLEDKDGPLSKLLPEDRAKVTEGLQALAKDGIQGNQDTAKDGSQPVAKAADGPRDEFEQLLDAANPRVIGALIGAIRGVPGGPAGILSGAVLGAAFGESSAAVARDLWRALPESVRQTILPIIRPVINPLLGR